MITQRIRVGHEVISSPTNMSYYHQRHHCTTTNISSKAYFAVFFYHSQTKVNSSMISFSSMHANLLIFHILFTIVQFSDVTSFSYFLDNCSFAGHFCSWINDNSDDFDWLLNSGETMTQETGPSTDADGDGNERKDTLSFPWKFDQFRRNIKLLKIAEIRFDRYDTIKLDYDFYFLKILWPSLFWFMIFATYHILYTSNEVFILNFHPIISWLIWKRNS